MTTCWTENGIGVYIVFNEDHGKERKKPGYIYPNSRSDSPEDKGSLVHDRFSPLYRLVIHKTFLTEVVVVD